MRADFSASLRSVKNAGEHFTCCEAHWTADLHTAIFLPGRSMDRTGDHQGID